MNKEKSQKANDFDRMRELEQLCEIEFMSYGLAPNPTGYCYELIDLDELGLDVDEQDVLRENRRKYEGELVALCDTAPEGFFNWRGV